MAANLNEAGFFVTEIVDGNSVVELMGK